MRRTVLACAPSLQAQARPKVCRVPGTSHLARVVPGPGRLCRHAHGLVGPARLPSYTQQRIPANKLLMLHNKKNQFNTESISKNQCPTQYVVNKN